MICGESRQLKCLPGIVGASRDGSAKQVEQAAWREAAGWQQDATLKDAQLALVFGDRAAIANPGRVSAAALGGPVDLALLISCVGRRMVLRQRLEAEGKGVRDIVGAAAAMAGFYSYGEISPFTPRPRCELPNQTMTVTTFAEAVT